MNKAAIWKLFDEMVASYSSVVAASSAGPSLAARLIIDQWRFDMEKIVGGDSKGVVSAIESAMVKVTARMDGKPRLVNLADVSLIGPVEVGGGARICFRSTPEETLTILEPYDKLEDRLQPYIV